MTDQDFVVLLCAAMALFVVFFYRQKLGDVGTIAAGAVIGLAAGAAIVLKRRTGDRATDLVEATLVQNDKQMKVAVKKLNKLNDQAKAIEEKHAAKKPTPASEPSPTTVDFLRKR